MPTTASQPVHYGCTDSATPFERHWILCMDMHHAFLDRFTKTSDIEHVTCQDCHKRYRRLEPLLHHRHFLHRGTGFYVLQIPCLKSFEYPTFGPIPSTDNAHDVTCPQCEKYVARLMTPRHTPRKKATAVLWCVPCNRWWIVQATERQMKKPRPCPACATMLTKDSSNPKNPLPHIHINLAYGTKQPTDATLLRCINRHLADYPAESIYTGDEDLGFFSQLSIDTPRKCHKCKQQRKEERRRKDVEKRRRAWTRYFMKDGMTREEAEQAVYDAEQDADGEAHEAWVASLDSDEHPWVNNPD